MPDAVRERSEAFQNCSAPYFNLTNSFLGQHWSFTTVLLPLVDFFFEAKKYTKGKKMKGDSGKEQIYSCCQVRKCYVSQKITGITIRWGDYVLWWCCDLVYYFIGCLKIRSLSKEKKRKQNAENFQCYKWPRLEIIGICYFLSDNGKCEHTLMKMFLFCLYLQRVLCSSCWKEKKIKARCPKLQQSNYGGTVHLTLQITGMTIDSYWILRLHKKGSGSFMYLCACVNFSR